MKTRAILTDIEGTTTSVSFVFEVLFPYARKNLQEFLKLNGNDPMVRQQMDGVRQEEGRDLSDEEVGQVLIDWIDGDKKATPLKTLQGIIWETGYRNGDFTGHVYEDAVLYLKKWHDEDLRLYIYSSGSVQAQKLLFGFSDAGDLTPLFQGYFDTRIGHKREVESYRKIAGEIGLPADEILFLSDICEELEAAREAGMQTTWLVRDEQKGECQHPSVKDFSQIEFK